VPGALPGSPTPPSPRRQKRALLGVAALVGTNDGDVIVADAGASGRVRGLFPAHRSVAIDFIRVDPRLGILVTVAGRRAKFWHMPTGFILTDQILYPDDVTCCTIMGDKLLTGHRNGGVHMVQLYGPGEREVEMKQEATEAAGRAALAAALAAAKPTARAGKGGVTFSGEGGAIATTATAATGTGVGGGGGGGGGGRASDARLRQGIGEIDRDGYKALVVPVSLVGDHSGPVTSVSVGLYKLNSVDTGVFLSTRLFLLRPLAGIQRSVAGQRTHGLKALGFNP
jgi:hypothetical protein